MFNSFVEFATQNSGSICAYSALSLFLSCFVYGTFVAVISMLAKARSNYTWLFLIPSSFIVILSYISFVASGLSLVAFLIVTAIKAFM